MAFKHSLRRGSIGAAARSAPLPKLGTWYGAALSSSAIGRMRRSEPEAPRPVALGTSAFHYLPLRSLTKTRATHALRPLELRVKLADFSGGLMPRAVIPTELGGLPPRSEQPPTVLEALAHFAQEPGELLRLGVQALLIDTAGGITPYQLPAIRAAVERIWAAGVDILVIGINDSVISFGALRELVPPDAIVAIYIETLLDPAPLEKPLRPAHA